MSEFIDFKDFNSNGSTGPEDIDMLYHEYITGPQGARYELLREKHHTNVDVEKAKLWLKRNMDVVKIYILIEK